jgi:outer membrane protein assembly factor BamA
MFFSGQFLFRVARIQSLTALLFIVSAADSLHAAADSAAVWIRPGEVRLAVDVAIQESALRSALPDSFPSQDAHSLIDSVQRALHAELGYYNPRLESLKTSRGSDGPVLLVRLESGRPARIGLVRLEGASALDTVELREVAGSLRGLRAGKTGMELALRRLTEAAADQGYPFCRVELAGVEPDSTGRGIDLLLRLESGRRCRLGHVSFPGLKITRHSVALRLSGLHPGDDYCESEAQAVPGRLLRSGLFRSAAAPKVAQGNDPWRADIALAVQEAAGSTLDAALGSGGPSGASGVSGYFRLEMNNLFGAARRARVFWERPRRDWSALELSYNEPWLLGRDLTLEASFSQSLRDSLYSSTGGALHLSTSAGEYGRAGLGALYERISPGSETWEMAQNGDLWAVEGNFERKSLDRPSNPSIGSLIQTRASAGRRSVSGLSRREIRAVMALSAFYPLARRTQVAAMTAGCAFVGRGASTVAELPYQARIPVGGASRDGGPSVRGHAEEELRARRALWLSLEYRYLTSPAGRLYLFYDMCAVQAPDTPERVPGAAETARWKSSVMQGYGAGMQIETRLGLLGLALALQPGRGPSDARLHLKMTGSF